MFVRRAIPALLFVLCGCFGFAQVPGQNINMVSGTVWPAGDPYLQRQNEPSMAVSSRNPEHILAGSNDYRTVDIPNTNLPNAAVLGDAWLSVYTSLDGGDTWRSTLLPGYPQDTSAIGKTSPLHAFTVATDPTVRAGTNGMFYYSGLVFNRGNNSPSGVFVATLQDQNNKGNGDAPLLQNNPDGTSHGNPFAYLGAFLVDTGTSGQFLDKPWIAVDIPRPGRTASCKVNGVSFNSGYVYVVYTQFNGSNNNPSSKIRVVTSTNCGASWSNPMTISQSQKLAQGTIAAIDPSNGNLYVAWRQIASSGNQNQADAIQWAYSTNGGNTFTDPPPLYTFAATSANNPYPQGSVFDQPQASSSTFRTLDVPAMAVDGNSRVWVAFSQRFNGPTPNTYGSRIMVTTLPAGSNKWTPAYVADSTAPTATTYGHEFMPSLNFAYGKMMLAWFDSRRDNLENILACVNPPAGGQCTDLSQLTPTDQAIPGSTVATPSTVFTPLISDPNSGIRHTIDIFGGMIDPSGGPAMFKGFQISQYAYWVNGQDNNQIEQGFFNPPNLPMFVQGTTPFIGDYIDIAAQSILPSGGSWAFNTQAKDPVTGATNAPDFHITWTDNRDVVPPPVVGGNQDWTIYYPPNSGFATTSTYSGTGGACPTCSTTQPACANVQADDGTIAAYSGDRNQNVYTSRVTNGLVVRFAENAKPLSNTIPRSFSLLVKDTLSPLSTVPPGASSYFRIMLGVTSVNQTPTCSVAGGGMASLPGGLCYMDVAITPKTTLTQPITITGSTSANASLPVLVAQTNCTPTVNVSTGPVTCSNNPTATGLQALAVINGDPSNPAVVNADQVSGDNSDPDMETPYGNVPIVAGEEYNPIVDAPPTDATNTPKINAPTVFTPQIVTAANNTPKIDTPTVFTPQINTPKIFSVQVVNPTIVDTINTPKINTPKINTPKIVSPDIFTPQITNLSDGTNPVTDFTWKVANKGNTTATYDTTEFTKNVQDLGVSCCPASCAGNPSSCKVTGSNPAGPNCSVCQLIQHKVYESPTANRDSNTGAATCELNVQQETIVESNIPSPAFTTSGVGSPTDPTSTLSVSPGVGKRVTLRVVKPNLQNGAVSSFKTFASSYNANNINGVSTPASSLTISTSTLPVAIVGQRYSASLSSIGGLGVTAWSVPPDPTNPVGAILPIPPQPIGTGANYFLSQAGQITNANVTDSPGTYFPFNAQVQDSAVPAALDVQQLQLLVNHFSITGVDVAINNNNVVGTIGYMKSGDMATVTVSINNEGPATASSITPTLMVNPTAAGTPSGPTPTVTCTDPTPVSPQVGFTLSSNTSGNFAFTCTAFSGNGYVTFTASATAQYQNAPAPTSNAIAVPVVVPPNTDNLVSQVVVDVVAPSLTFGATTTSPSAPGSLWYNQPVVIPFTTSDNLSGVKAATPTAPAISTGIFPSGTMTLTTEGTAVTGTMTVTDFALNPAVFPSAAFQIDRTPPIITGGRAPLANAFGWNNTAVTATFSCSDPIPNNGPAGQESGLAPQPGGCTPQVTLTTEGAGQSVTGTAIDNAVNKSQFTVSGISIDFTPPTITPVLAPSSPSGNNGWYTGPVMVSFVCADALSGVASCTAPVTLMSDGANQSVQGFASDKAGNPNTSTATGINVDQTAPAITTSSTYMPGTWTGPGVIVQFTCTDNLSGVVLNNPIITDIPANNPLVTYTQTALSSTATVTLTQATTSSGATLSASCQDVAGNNATPVVFGPILISADQFKGFDAPLTTASAPASPSNSGTFNTGSTIPVMFQMLTPTGYDTAKNVTLSNLTVYGNSACAGAPPAGSPTTVLYDAASSTGSFTFEPSDAVYTVSWNTGAAAPGCYDIVATMNDQSVYATMVTLAAPSANTTLLQYNFDNVPLAAVPNASQTAPPSYSAPNVSGGAFGYHGASPNGMQDNGCSIGLCIDPAQVASGEYYFFSLTNTAPISNGSISFREFNNDCQPTGTCPPGVSQSFTVEYDTDPTFSGATTVTVASFTPTAPGSQSYSFPISGQLVPNTYYFRIVATGVDHDGTGQYVLDNVTIAGSH